MGTLLRLGSTVWPYRKRIFLSVICAVLISALWSLNLSITYPIVRVLFENDSLHAYVDTEIDGIEAEIEELSGLLRKASESNVSHRANVQQKLNDAAQQLLFKQRLKTWVLPWIPSNKFKTILAILSLVIFATVMKGAFQYAQELLVGSVAYASSNDIRRETFEHIMELDYQSVQSRGSAQLTSRLTNDIGILSDGIRLSGSLLVREPLKAICCILAAMLFNWRLTCISMLILPLIGIVFYRTGRILRRVAASTMETMGNIYHRISETFDSTRVVIAFNGQPHHRDQLVSANKEFYDTSMKLTRVGALMRPATELLATIGFIGILVPGAYLVLNNTDKIAGVKLASGPLGIAELTTLYVLMAGVLDPVRKLSGVFPVIKRASAAADRIYAVADQITHVPETETPVPAVTHSKHILFDNISFRYESSEEKFLDQPPTLQDARLKVNFGEVVAVVGGNGSGKSTLISLLPRLIDPAKGAVRIDGVDIRDLALNDLRKQIGLVTQDTMLFDDTIYNNVLYGNPQATAAEIEAAIKQAHAADFVSLLPQGLSTPVGIKGQKLSGGQKQRISLARAIVRNPAILILDEATSAIDAESESVIYDVLREFSRGRTVFIISHVISQQFVDLIDRVVVLEAGQIIADGSHADLMESSPEYGRLVQSDVVKKAA
ncbi:MAG: ABC transporter ATP-binding protein [Fuerstiella sp.]|nr:ABC transporter ATP-binding protein [Fuerstiella sp.]MCP4787488.1 ABC transporter ATP-binding protein [Fuerstiella sp.]MCP4859015.1 ABC transporter ATP-binding protein [Fuerstiella sp.]